jgi:hypothetical protein
MSNAQLEAAIERGRAIRTLLRPRAEIATITDTLNALDSGAARR